jgi:hypothetical protein
MNRREVYSGQYRTNENQFKEFPNAARGKGQTQRAAGDGAALLQSE